ncbi:MAG: tripartite tricarboxylate transporter family receptor [Hyphomicrobiales bacterium]|nr:tripartite tricarboxylate transporter family receptor [Hyphomicrobiales bacterium]
MRLLSMAACVACFAPTLAPAADVTFRDKTITMLIAFEAGGPYDLYGRLLARHLGANLPGAPNVISQNMAGAGGVIGMNYLYNVAPRDGTTIGVVSQTVAIGQLLGVVPGLKYDVREINWLGRLNSNVEIQQSIRKSGFTSFDVAREREVVVAGTGPTSSSNIFPRLLNETIGTKFKVVTGYQGPNSAQLALERGEVAAIVKPWSSIKATDGDRLKSGDVMLNMQYTTTRHPELPDVPSVVDVARTPEQRQMFGLLASGSTLGTSVAAPPNVDKTVVATLRAGVAAALASSDLQAEAAKAKMDIDPLGGEAVQKLIAETFATPKETVEDARKFVERLAR